MRRSSAPRGARLIGSSLDSCEFLLTWLIQKEAQYVLMQNEEDSSCARSSYTDRHTHTSTWVTLKNRETLTQLGRQKKKQNQTENT